MQPAAPRRLEGPDKVRGRVAYAGDRHQPADGGPLDVAVAITGTQASGQSEPADFVTQRLGQLAFLLGLDAPPPAPSRGSNWPVPGQPTLLAALA